MIYGMINYIKCLFIEQEKIKETELDKKYTLSITQLNNFKDDISKNYWGEYEYLVENIFKNKPKIELIELHDETKEDHSILDIKLRTETMKYKLSIEKYKIIKDTHSEFRKIFFTNIQIGSDEWSNDDYSVINQMMRKTFDQVDWSNSFRLLKLINNNTKIEHCYFIYIFSRIAYLMTHELCSKLSDNDYINNKELFNLHVCDITIF